MTPSSLSRSPWRRLRAVGFIAAFVAAGGLAGCNTFGDTTGSISGSAKVVPAANDDAAWRAEANRWAKAYDANPGEKVASINYANALRHCQRYSEAVSVMRVAAVKSPRDYEVLGAYGKALADDGDLSQARDVLAKSYPMERPDWTILSVQGAVEDKLGNYEQAQKFYSEALKIAPGEPSVLTNLGLSYALDKQLPEGEHALRQAAASPRADARTRENLALVLALEGKFGEAEAISREDMTAEEAKANVKAIQAMIAQNDSWRAIQSKSVRTPKPQPSADPQG